MLNQAFHADFLPSDYSEKVQGQLLPGILCGQHQMKVFEIQEEHVPTNWEHMFCLHSNQPP